MHSKGSELPAHHWLNQAYRAKSNVDLARIYDEWSGEYDRDAQNLASMSKALVSGMVERYVGRSSGEILDAGCGTGSLGSILKLMGYRGLVGIDISRGMLDIAAGTFAYDELAIMALGEPLSFSDSRFAATLAVGVLTVAHAPADSLDELTRVTRPDGFLIFNLTRPAYERLGFKQKLTSLMTAKRWELEEEIPDYQIFPSPAGGDALSASLFVFRRC